MFRLFIHDSAQADLEKLWSSAPTVAARITVLLEECQGSQDLLDRLTQQGFGANRSTADFHVSQWFDQQQKNRNLWRLKAWDLENQGLRYRVVYAFIAQKHTYHVLAVAPREFDYDERHQLTQRIIRDYEEL